MPPGDLTYSGVVRRWELDHNDHWNVQFYIRAFQMASELVATRALGRNPGVVGALLWHFRFHRELVCPQPMRIHSARIAGGPQAGNVVHQMVSGSENWLSATAIEVPDYVPNLPAVSADAIVRALPRGLRFERLPWMDQSPSAPVGVVRPSDLDHLGALLPNVLLSVCASASHSYMGGLGLTAEWAKATGCNRMSVEMTLTRHALCRAGDHLAVATAITEVGARHFVLLHEVSNAVTGAACASVEQSLLVIDLKTRKPVDLPEFIRAAVRPA